MCKHTRYHIEVSDFVKLGWLPVSKRVEQLKLNLMYKISRDQAPSYLCDIYSKVSDLHGYRTRLSSNSGLVLPKFKSHGMKTFHFTAVKLWNSIPRNICDTNSYSHFKQNVKQHMYSSMQVAVA